MTDDSPGFFARLALSFAAFFRVLFDARYAGRVQRIAAGDSSPGVTKPEVPAVKLHIAPTESALQLLGLFQREGRLIDFLQEEVTSYSDAEIGAAARVLHDSLKKALLEHVTLARVRNETEGARVSVPKGFSASELRLVGNVVGEAPFSGTLNHAGWRATRIELPKLSEGHDVHVLAPAEVEL